MPNGHYCPVRKAHANRKFRYALTPETYAKLYARQKGACAICRKAIRLCVDHIAGTKIVRGLLCDHCNLLLGFAGDDIGILRAAIRYLKRHRLKLK